MSAMVRWNVTFFGLAACAGGNLGGSYGFGGLVQKVVPLSFPHTSQYLAAPLDASFLTDEDV